MFKKRAWDGFPDVPALNTRRALLVALMSGKLPLGSKDKETAKLKQNVQDQLARLLQQLSDLKEEKDSFSAVEYAEMEKDTLDQLRDFQDSLKKMTAGDLTLTDELSSVKLVRFIPRCSPSFCLQSAPTDPLALLFCFYLVDTGDSSGCITGLLNTGGH